MFRVVVCIILEYFNSDYEHFGCGSIRMQTGIASSKSLFEDFVINPGEKLYMGNNTYHPYPLNIGSLDIVPSGIFFFFLVPLFSVYPSTGA